MLAPSRDAKTVSIPLLRPGEDGRIRVLVAALEASAPTKGEFETTAAFKTRSAAARAGDIVPGIKRINRIAFLFSVNPNAMKYDADRQFFRFEPGPSSTQSLQSYVAPESVFGTYDQGKMTFADFLDEDTSSTAPETVEAQNSMGAHVTVTKTETTHWGVVIDKDIQQAGGLPPRFNAARWPVLRVPATDAPVVKGNVIGLLIGRIVDPPVLHDSFRHIPTFAEPTDTNDIKDVINLMPEALWFVRGDTGQVLAKVSAVALQPMSASELHAQQCADIRKMKGDVVSTMLQIEHCQ